MTSEKLTETDSAESLEKMADLARQEKFADVIQIGQETIARLNAQENRTAESPLLVRAHILVGDALASIKSFSESLSSYESAFSVGQEYLAEGSDEEMEILFKIERSLNVLGMLNRIGAAETEIKSLLVSQYLQTAKDNEDSQDIKTDSQFATKLLEKLWAVALEKQQIPEVTKKPDWLEKLDKFFQNRYVQAFLFQGVIWTVSIMLIFFMLDTAKLLARQGVQPVPISTRPAISQDYKKILADKTSLTVHSLDGNQTILFKPNNEVILYTAKGPIKGRLLFFDGSLTSALSAIAASNSSSSILFHCRGCSIASQDGAIFFLDKADDFKIVREINRMSKRIDSFVQKNKALPPNDSNLFIYDNALRKKVQVASVLEGKTARDLKAKLIAGSIAVLENRKASIDYDLVGFPHTGIAFAASRSKSGWKSRFDIEPINLPDGAEAPVFIFCEREMNPFLELLRTKLLLVLGASLAGTLCGFLALREVWGRFTFRHRVRKQSS